MNVEQLNRIRELDYDLRYCFIFSSLLYLPTRHFLSSLSNLITWLLLCRMQSNTIWCPFMEVSWQHKKADLSQLATLHDNYRHIIHLYSMSIREKCLAQVTFSLHCFHLHHHHHHHNSWFYFVSQKFTFFIISTHTCVSIDQLLWSDLWFLFTVVREMKNDTLLEALISNRNLLFTLRWKLWT